ncbi:MAG: two-component sensor histidine kinase, partial [Halanaerobium sp. MSAO_Bac5]
MSLKKRLIIYIMLIFLLIMTVIGYILVVQQRDIFQAEMERRGKLLARTLAEISKEAMLIYEFSTLVQNVRSLEGEEDLRNAKIINNNGRILASLNRDTEGSFTDSDYSQDRKYWEDNYLITVETINANGVEMGKSIIVLSQQSMLNRIGYSVKLIIIILVIALALLFIIINITA